MKLMFRSDLPARQHDILTKCSDRQCHRRVDQYKRDWRAVSPGIRSDYGYVPSSISGIAQDLIVKQPS